MTPREAELHKLLLTPVTRDEAAALMGIGYETAKVYCALTAKELNVRGRTGIMAAEIARLRHAVVMLGGAAEVERVK